MDINDLVTEDIDYTGCNPLIAECLKQGKGVWCRTRGGDRVLVIGYNENTSIGSYFTKCYRFIRLLTPIQNKRYFKPADQIIKWCIDNGWIPSHYSEALFMSPDHNQHLPLHIIKFYSNKLYNKEVTCFVHDEWLTTKEEN